MTCEADVAGGRVAGGGRRPGVIVARQWAGRSDHERAGAPGLRAAVSFHGVLGPPGLGPQPPSAAEVFILRGCADPMAPPEHVLATARELTDARADRQLHAYGRATHAFTAAGVDAPECGLRHGPAADRRSRAAMTGSLEEVLA